MATHVAGEGSMSSREKGVKGKGKSMLDHIRVFKGEGGGHIIEHHFKASDRPMFGMEEPKRFPFGADEGMKAHEHIEKHLGMKMDEEPAGEENGESGTVAEPGSSEE